MEYSETIYDRTGEAAIDASDLTKYVMRQIRRFSHSPDKFAIAGYVDEYRLNRSGGLWASHEKIAKNIIHKNWTVKCE
jgi:hypothetical protein